MIAFLFGTTGELIKIAPVIDELSRRGARPLLLTTAQQVQQIPQALDVLGLPQPDLYLGRGRGGRDLETLADIPWWLRRVARSYAAKRGEIRARLREGAGRPLFMVHGDTMSTVLGAAIGRSVGVPVAHVEAGLRSGDLRNPFPEELNRRITSRLATIHFAPGDWAASNLRAARVAGDIVDTGANTVADSLRLAAGRPLALATPPPPFGLVSVHRFELLGNGELMRELLVELREAAQRFPLLFIDHPVTVAAIDAHGLHDLFDDAGLRRVPRLPYPEFVTLMARAGFMVTDSGGSQEECAHLGIPCLVHRAATERLEGLDGPVVLSRFDMDVVRAFLADPLAGRGESEEVAGARPTEVIVDFLASRGYTAG